MLLFSRLTVHITFVLCHYFLYSWNLNKLSHWPEEFYLKILISAAEKSLRGAHISDLFEKRVGCNTYQTLFENCLFCFSLQILSSNATYVSVSILFKIYLLSSQQKSMPTENCSPLVNTRLQYIRRSLLCYNCVVWLKDGFVEVTNQKCLCLWTTVFTAVHNESCLTLTDPQAICISIRPFIHSEVRVWTTV